MASMPQVVIGREGLQVLIDVLRADGWMVIGPTVRDSVIGLGEISVLDDLPCGIGDVQESAEYRLRDRSDGAIFASAVGPQSWKSILFPAAQVLRRESSSEGAIPDEDLPVGSERPSLALLGVRSCDLHAIGILDHVLQGRSSVDFDYAARRRRTLIIAVACSEPGGTCFCASMGTGPDPRDGFDLCLTELLGTSGHRFVVRVGSTRGEALLDRIPAEAASEADVTAARLVVEEASSRMGRQLDTDDLHDLLFANALHPQWDDVAERCLACANCTLVCPTCFCTSVEDSADLAGGTLERVRVWDSCFTSEFTHLAGGSIRGTTAARYRQWATHKLASWWDQFGSSGCVGCGRCVTWCPAAIDITREVTAIRSAPMDISSNHPREA